MLIDNVCDYLYLKESENGNFKFEVDAHQLDLRLHHFSQFPLNVKKKKNQKLAGLWLAGEMVNHVGIYGSKAAEGLSAFQRRSCSRLSVEFQGHMAKKSSILTQIGHFRTVAPVWIHQWLQNDAQSWK